MFVNGFTRSAWSVGARLVVILSVLTGSQIVAATGAGAHTGLVACTPTYGATLTAAPKDVRLTFSEPVRSEFLEMSVRVDGTTVFGARPVAVGPVVRMDTSAVPAAAALRTWEVAYRVVAADGHPISGTLRFETDPAAAATGETAGGCSGGGGNAGVVRTAAVTGGILLVLGIGLAVIRRRVLAA